MGVGVHLLADFYGCGPEELKDEAGLGACLREGARRASMTPVAPPVLHRFEGGGLTGFILLAESHIAFHTYPELGYAALDVFSCGRGDAAQAVAAFRELLRPEREQVGRSERGALVPSPAAP